MGEAPGPDRGDARRAVRLPDRRPGRQAFRFRQDPRARLDRVEFADESDDRARRDLERRLTRSRLGRFKPMADGDWSWPTTIDRDAVEAALRLDFLAAARNVVLVAPQGLGKTMSAQNIAHQAALAGHSVLFTTGSQLLLDLTPQDSARGRDRRLRHYGTRTTLLVIDEIGYLSYDNRNADVAAAQCGDLLNVSSVARDAGISAPTALEYFQILEDTLLAYRREPWRKSVRAGLVAHPNVYLFDTGVTNALNRRLSGTLDPVTRGRLFEQWRVLECRRLLDYAGSEARILFCRTNHGTEVDLLLERHKRIVAAVEITSTQRVAGADLTGLRSFAEEHPGVPRFVVTPSAKSHRLEDVLVTNWRDFLEQFRSWL